MKEKECFKCKETKPLDFFYKNKRMTDGYLNKCKECTKKDVVKNRASHIDYYREYDRNRAMSPHRVKARKIYAKKNKDVINSINQRWRSRNREKSNAHSLLAYALKTHKIEQTPCVMCGETKVQGHHSDYSRPLDVVWLCDKCYKDVHRGSNV